MVLDPGGQSEEGRGPERGCEGQGAPASKAVCLLQSTIPACRPWLLSGRMVVVILPGPPWHGAVAASCFDLPRYPISAMSGQLCNGSCGNHFAERSGQPANYRPPIVLTDPASPIICPHLNVGGGITDKDRKRPRLHANLSASASVAKQHGRQNDASEQARYFSRVKQTDGKIGFS